MWQVGTAKVNITPPIGCLMDGYGGRDHGAEGIHDELYARALAISDDHTMVALVAVEMIGLTTESVAAIRQRIEAATGLPGSHVFIFAVHTHSGPACRPGEDDLTNRALAAIEDKIVGGVIMAQAQMQPGYIQFGRADVLCGVNRREARGGKIVLGVNPTGPVYPYVDFLHVTGHDGNTIAVWYCHPCHPVVMGPANYQISGDFPGAASRFLEYNLGGVAMFANGCCGNINSYPHQGTFADVERLGRRLGAAVIKGLTELPLPEQASERLDTLEHCILLPLEELPPVAELRQALEAQQAELAAATDQNRRFWAKRRLRSLQQQLRRAEAGERGAGMPATIQVVGLGDTALVGLPFEVFVEIGQAIQAGSPFAHTVVLGYTNGYMGYVPTRAAVPLGGYEVERARASYQGSPIAAAAGDVLIGESLAALQALWERMQA